MAKRRALVAEIVWPSCEDGKRWDVILSFQTPKDEIGLESFISIRPFNFRFLMVFLCFSNVELLGCFLKHLVELAETRTYQTSERTSWIAWLRLGIVTCWCQCWKNSRRVSPAKIWMKISGSFFVKVVAAFTYLRLWDGLCLIDLSLWTLLTLSNFYNSWTTWMSIVFVPWWLVAVGPTSSEWPWSRVQHQSLLPSCTSRWLRRTEGFELSRSSLSLSLFLIFKQQHIIGWIWCI